LSLSEKFIEKKFCLDEFDLWLFENIFLFERAFLSILLWEI